MAFAPPLFAAFIRQLNKAVADTRAEFQMSVEVKGLADVVRDARAAIRTASNASASLRDSAGRVVDRVAQVQAMVGELNKAEAELGAALAEMSNGGPPLDDGEPTSQSSSVPSDVRQASIQVANANSGVFK